MELVCLEGCSGAGKTTQYKILQNKLDNRNVLFAVEKEYEPFKTEVQKWHEKKGPNSKLNYNDIISFAKARAETFQRNFAEKSLDFLVLDRYYYTSAVYQCNNEISPEEILLINKEYGAPIPKLTFLFECNPELAFNRSYRRNQITGGKHLFSTGADKIKIIQNRYRRLSKSCPEVKIINTEKSISEITEEILSKIKLYF